MIYGIKLKIKTKREELRREESKDKRNQNPERIKSIKRIIKSKKLQIKKIKGKKDTKK